jgi:hypothetical protein
MTLKSTATAGSRPFPRRNEGAASWLGHRSPKATTKGFSKKIVVIGRSGLIGSKLVSNLGDPFASDPWED